jgi:hypothetical protein
MTEQEAIEVVEETLLNDQSIPAKLWMKQGIDKEAVARLENAIENLITIFQSRDYVPKKIAAAFLDLTPDFERALDLYSEQEQRHIEDLKLRIISRAHDLLDPA